ncbi:MAG: hypothetical protein HKO91_03135, partial [Desulfobacterales bacterium]|nr:hypothetical protein [Desulfobacterales bacterium]
LTLWDISTGREIRSFAKHHSSIHKIVFSPNGRFVLIGYNDGEMTLLEVSSGRKVRLFRGSSSKICAAAYSPDGSLSITGADNGDLVLWNVKNGRVVKIFKGHMKAVSSIAFSPDGRLALSGSDDYTLKLWDVIAGKSGGNFYGHTDAVTSIVFSPGGKFAISASKDGTCKLWDISTKKEIRTFKGHSHWVNSVSISPDGQTMVSGSSDSTIKFWDITTGREIRTLKDDTGWILSTAFSPDGRFMLSGSWQIMTLWEVSSGRKIRTLKGHSGNITSVSFSPDGNYYLSGSDDHKIRLWNAFNGREVNFFKGHLDEVNIVCFSTSGRHVLSGSLDMTTRIWDTVSGEEIIRMVASEDGEWLVVTPDGYYNTSPEGASLLHWVSPGGMETFTYEQFESSFKRPDIIKDRLAINLDIGRPAPEMSTPPHIEMREHLDIKETHEKSYPLTLSVSALESVRTVRIFTNGKPTMEIAVNEKKKKLSLVIPLLAGANRITAVAYDDKGFSSNLKYLDVISKHAGLAQPNLHVLAVGISAYPKLSQKWQLDYAHTDAQSLVGTLQTQEGKLFGEVRQNLLINDEVTVKKITDVLDTMSSVSVNDLLLIFMAGHGVKDKDGTFYFLTSEGSFQNLGEGGLSWSVLKKYLSKIKGRVILMLDACHSGSVVTETVVPNDELAQKFFAEGGGGIMAFSASKGRQFSLESPDIGGGFGLFTYALVQSLGPKAEVVDTNNNNFVEFMELVDYVTDYVDDVTRGEQTPWLSRRELFGDIPLSRVN